MDWATITAWAVGIATVAGSVIGTLWVAIDRAIKVAKTLPAPLTKTDVITTDTVAYEQLSRTIEGNTLELVQSNRLLAEIVVVGADFTSMMREQRQEEEFEAEVEKRLKDRIAAERRRTRNKKPTPSPQRRVPKAETG